MQIDIHRHSESKGDADYVLRNLFPDEKVKSEEHYFYSIGLHPWHVEELSYIKKLELVRKKSNTPEVLAIGEIGLDKSKDINIDIQRKAFIEQIDIAKSLNKPVVIHCVKAYDELLSIKKSSIHKEKWIIHWFNASYEMGMDLINKGCYLSFGVSLFKENSKVFKAFTKFPLNRIFLETDDVNISIRDIYNKASQLHNITLTSLEEQIKSNFNECFNTNL